MGAGGEGGGGVGVRDGEGRRLIFVGYPVPGSRSGDDRKSPQAKNGGSPLFSAHPLFRSSPMTESLAQAI